MSAEVFGLTQQILMLISAYINTGVCGKLRIFGKTATHTMITKKTLEFQLKPVLTVLA